MGASPVRLGTSANLSFKSHMGTDRQVILDREISKSYSLTLLLLLLALTVKGRRCQQGRGQPSSFAAVLRKASVSPVARRLWASHSMHLSISACQLMMFAARHW